MAETSRNYAEAFLAGALGIWVIAVMISFYRDRGKSREKKSSNPRTRDPAKRAKKK